MFFRFITIWAVVVFLIGCGNNEITLKGNVFIVTGGGQNIKLGLVPVHLISVEKLNSYFDTKLCKDSITYQKECEKTLKEFDDLNKSYYEFWPDYLAAEHVLKDKKQVLEKYATIDENLKKIYKTSHGDAEFKCALEDFQIVESILVEKGIELKPRYEACLAKIDSLEKYHDSIMSSIISGILSLSEQTAKSDADGNFSFIVKKGKKYIVIAMGQRELLDRELYYWFVDVNIPDKHKGAFKLMLSNHNMKDDLDSRMHSYLASYVYYHPKFAKIFAVPVFDLKKISVRIEQPAWEIVNKSSFSNF